MKNELIRLLDIEIKARGEELDRLIEARQAVAAGSSATDVETPSKKPGRKAVKAKQARKVKAPARKRKSASARGDQGGDAIDPETVGAEINGKFVKMSARMSQIFDLLDKAPEGEAVSIDKLAAVFDGHHGSTYSEIARLKKAMAPAKATVVCDRGKGYRLETL